MSQFLTPLIISAVEDNNGIHLQSRLGQPLWIVSTKPFSYKSDYTGMVFRIPVGFITDFASVPRVPFIYDNLGNIFPRPALLHDFFYQSKILKRKTADKVLIEAMKIDKITPIRRWFVYVGVRIFGGSYY